MFLFYQRGNNFSFIFFIQLYLSMNLVSLVMRGVGFKCHCSFLFALVACHAIKEKITHVPKKKGSKFDKSHQIHLTGACVTGKFLEVE